MVLNRKFLMAMAPAACRTKFIVKSLIFLVLLVLAGIGVASGSEAGGHDSTRFQVAGSIAQQDQSLGSGYGRG
jgi:hypothetical protein